MAESECDNLKLGSGGDRRSDDFKRDKLSHLKDDERPRDKVASKFGISGRTLERYHKYGNLCIGGVIKTTVFNSSKMWQGITFVRYFINSYKCKVIIIKYVGSSSFVKYLAPKYPPPRHNWN